MSDYERISITIDAELLARLDEHIVSAGHGNRSEAIRDLVRARLVQDTSPEEEVAGSLTVLFDHRQRTLSDRLTEAAHDHDHIVLSTLHVHLDRDTCMELSAMRGRRGALQHYAAHLLGMKGVLGGQLVITARVC